MYCTIRARSQKRFQQFKVRDQGTANSHLDPVHMYPDFFSLFSTKYASTRSVVEAFSSVHTKTLKQCKYDRNMRHTRSIWCMTSSYSITSVFVRPHVNEKPAFSKMSTMESVFWKYAFSVTVFKAYVRTVGQTRRKKISVFKQKLIHVDGPSQNSLRPRPHVSGYFYPFPCVEHSRLSNSNRFL